MASNRLMWNGFVVQTVCFSVGLKFSSYEWFQPMDATVVSTRVQTVRPCGRHSMVCDEYLIVSYMCLLKFEFRLRLSKIQRS